MPRLLAALLLLLLATNSALALRICSFNIRSFGESKRENQKVMDVIVKVSPFRWEGSLDPCPLLSDLKRLRLEVS